MCVNIFILLCKQHEHLYNRNVCFSFTHGFQKGQFSQILSAAYLVRFLFMLQLHAWPSWPLDKMSMKPDCEPNANWKHLSRQCKERYEKKEMYSSPTWRRGRFRRCKSKYENLQDHIPRPRARTWSRDDQLITRSNITSCALFLFPWI